MSSLGPAETERNAGSPSDVPRTTNNVRLMLNLSALMSFASISTDMYLPALPAISRALHTDSAGVELTFSAFLIGFSLGQLIWGPISDRFGRKFPILIGMVLFIIGSVGCALSTTVTEMMVWRVVQALGACVGPVLSRAMVRDLYGREQSAKMLSTLILIMGVAPIAGPLVGGQILLLWSWPAIFWALAIVGLVTLFSFGRLPESLPPKHRTREPLRHTFATYLQLIRDPRLIGYALSGGFFYGGAYAFIVGTPFAYIDFYQVSPQAYGWLFGVNIVGMMIANFINGRLLSRMSSEQLFYRGAWTLAFFGVVLSVCVLFGWGGIWGLVIPIFFYMSMNGLIVANSVAGALAFFPPQSGFCFVARRGHALRQRHFQRSISQLVGGWNAEGHGAGDGWGWHRLPGGGVVVEGSSRREVLTQSPCPSMLKPSTN